MSDERMSDERMSDDEFITEVLGVYSDQTGKDINTIIEETLLEKSICLGPYVYLVETLKMMSNANAAIERLRRLGVTTNLDALTDFNNRYKAAIANAAPWIFRGDAMQKVGYKSDTPVGAETADLQSSGKTVSEDIDDLIRRIARGEHRQGRDGDGGYGDQSRWEGDAE